ncbi:hypothetical protein Bca4012_020423 [Brassica carinata]
MAFLRFEPFSIKSYWQSLIQRSLGQGNKNRLSSLQVLMATNTLQRTKEKSLIGLSPKIVGTCYVDLSAEERQIHDHMEGEAKGVVQNLINSGRSHFPSVEYSHPTRSHFIRYNHMV